MVVVEAVAQGRAVQALELLQVLFAQLIFDPIVFALATLAVTLAQV